MGNINGKDGDATGSDSEMLPGVSSTMAMDSEITSDSNMAFVAADACPSIITPQVPQVPLSNGDDLARQWSCQLRGKTDETPKSEATIATLLEWSHGGNSVSVEGSWDNWSTRSPLHKASKDFTLVKFLPAGVYHYKFFVDGVWRHSPDLPFTYDHKGSGINILDVQAYVPENLTSMEEFDAPLSPDSSYDSPFPGPEDFSKDPPLLPPQLYLNTQFESLNTTLKSHSGLADNLNRPQHVILNHLFMETRNSSLNPVLTLGFTQRFRTKYVTVILHKPLRR